ncbi:MAG: toxin-antitoxin system YwqK family antitoxin [Flavobacteriaceae bacterium]
MAISILILNSCKQEDNKSFSVYSGSVIVSSLSKELSITNNTLFLNNSEFNGTIYELYKNGDTLAIKQIINGLQDGISKKWYPNKQLMETREYQNGQKNGKQIAYFQNGIKKFEFIAKNDIYEGELKEWNIGGDLIHLSTYKNGQEDGTQKMWYDNGKIRANYVIKNGKRYGLLGTKNCINVSDSIFVVK